MRWSSFFRSPAFVEGDKVTDKDREQGGGVSTATEAEDRGEAGGERGGAGGGRVGAGAGGDRHGRHIHGGAAWHDPGKGSPAHEPGKSNEPQAVTQAERGLNQRLTQQAKHLGGREGVSGGLGRDGGGLRVFMSPTVTYSPRTRVGIGGGSMGGPAGSTDEPSVGGHVVGFSTMVSEARPW